MMKLGLALSVLCLLGSIGFWVTSTLEDPVVEAPDPVAPTRPSRPDGVSGTRQKVWSGHALGNLESAAVEEAAEFDEEVEDELEAPAPEEAVLRGRVAVALGELPEGTRVYLTGVATRLPPDEEALEPDEGAAGDEGEDEDDEELASDEEEDLGVTDEQEVYEGGEFEFFVQPGQYQLLARAPGHLPAVLQDLKVSAGDDVRGLFLDLRAGLSIKGSVSSEGEPQDGVPVVAEGEGFRITAFSDEEGNFEIAGLAPGSYQVRAFVEFLGGDERQALAGGQVALELARRGRLSGKVVDERGFAVAGAAVFGVAYGADEDGVDQDPYGEVENEGDYGGMGMSGCGPAPSCRELATTDSSGGFEIEVAQGALLALGASSGDARAAVEGVRTDARDVVLTLHRAAPVRLTLTAADGKPSAGRVYMATETGRFDFASGELTAGADGKVVYFPWADVPTTLRAEGGLRLNADDPLPPSTDIQAQRRYPHRREIVLIY
ncbi:MAG: carboxypeptidase-like regulatory domain-containing protein [Myxococcaceae bacterium]